MAETAQNPPGETSPSGSSKLYEIVGRFNMPADPAARAERVAGLTTEDLIAMVAEMHTALAPGTDINPTANSMHVKSPNGLDDKELVKPDERIKVFEQVVGLVHELSGRIGQGDEEAFLERAANLVGLGVVLAHPYEDGNGRTARTLGHLIRYGYDESEEIKNQLRLVSSNRPGEGFRINSYVPTGAGGDMAPEELLQSAAALQLPLKSKQVYDMSSRAEFTTPYS